jgi:hypothetical protein
LIVHFVLRFFVLGFDQTFRERARLFVGQVGRRIVRESHARSRCFISANRAWCLVSNPFFTDAFRFHRQVRKAVVRIFHFRVFLVSFRKGFASSVTLLFMSHRK